MTDRPLFNTVREVLAVKSDVTIALEHIVGAVPQAKLELVPDIPDATAVYARLPDYAAFVVSTPEWLRSELLQETEVTPIVFIGSEESVNQIVKREGSESLDDAVRHAMEAFNLSGIARIDEPAKAAALIERVTARKGELQKMVGAMPRTVVKDIILQDRKKPRFDELVNAVEQEYKERERMIKLIMPDDPKNRPFVFDALMLRTFLEWNTYPPQSPLKKDIEKTLANYLVEYVKQVKAGARTDGRLGESISGEEGMLGRLERMQPHQRRVSYTHAQDLRWKILRIIADDNAGNDHKDIAMQRHQDSFALSQEDGYVTPLMTRPVHLDEYGYPLSITLQQDVEGPTLEKVFQKIDQDLERVEKESQEAEEEQKKELEKRKELLLKLRKEIVTTYIDRVAQFQNLGLKTFAKKPKGEDIRELYKERLGDFYDLFSILTPGLFSEEEGLAYLEGLKSLDAVDMSEENIVRVRDAALPNAAIRPDKVRYVGSEIDFTIDDVVGSVTTDGHVDSNKLKEKFYDIDIHYRWGHILEDITHIFSARETAFLVSGGRRKAQSTLRQNMRYFLQQIDRLDLNDDKASAYLMSFYRSARKLKLFATRYIRNAHYELESGILTKTAFDRRRREFNDVIKHHARSCNYILERMRDAMKRNGLRVGIKDRRKVDEWYNAARADFNPETARPFVESLGELSERGKLYAQVSALAVSYRKLRSHLSNKRNQLNFEGLWGNGTS